jgi:broad specificity phosphatase PhoE
MAEPQTPPGGEDRPPFAPMVHAFFTGLDHGELVLVRHGQQEFPGENAPGGEWVDPPLSELGHRQAAAVGQGLAGENIDAVFASPLKRALVTGQNIAGHHDLEVTIDERLREIHLFGELPHDARPRDHLSEEEIAVAAETFGEHRKWDAFPATESGAEFRARVTPAIDAIAAAHAGQRVVIACHAGVINAYLADVLGTHSDMFFRAAHASVSRVHTHEGRRVMFSANEVHHLAAVDPALVTH